ncbi:MAG: porin [Bacteroidota bacterium]
MLQKLLFILLLTSASVINVSAQTPDQPAQNTYLPKIDGSLKTKFEYDLANKKMRFEVRNARFGAKGNINKYFGYRVEVDLSDEGKIKMLDAYVKVTPVENLDVYLGQRKVPFGTDYLRNPVENLFANRSFVAKYVNNELRDIGLVVNYQFKFHIPFDFWVAAMNGTGNNNPQWIDKPNYAARLIIEPLKNFRLVGNFYQATTLLEKDMTMYGGEMRYQTSKILIETEFLKRHYSDTSSLVHDQFGFYIHSYYNFFTGAEMVQVISPTLRWDFMGKAEQVTELTADRITAGVNFGFEPKQFKAEIRLNYEKYLKKALRDHFDKFTVEFIAKF